MAFTIYLITCPEGRHYVGCTKLTAAARWKQFQPAVRTDSWNGKFHLSDAIKRFGKGSFKVETLATVEREDDAAAIETFMIARYAAAWPTGHNAMRTSSYRANKRKAA